MPSALSRFFALLQVKGITIVLLACVVGALSGTIVTVMSRAVQAMHTLLYDLPIGVRLSGLLELPDPRHAFVPVVGGVIMCLISLYLLWFRPKSPIDPVEANALYGGRMSLNDTLIVAVQTMVSSGFGASVGLEAGYTQMGSGVASRIARAFDLRRNDVRLLVGCGAAGAISAAFGAPLTGAFYGFELIIGVYAPANVAPVMAAAVSASLVASQLGAAQFPIEIGAMPPITPDQYLPFLLLGMLSGVVSVAVMRLVTLVEQGFSALRIRSSLRPILGGMIVGLLSLVSPQVLSSGHGAMHLYLVMHFGVWTVALLFLLKLMASAVSLGCGFRGGLFFASLFLGALLGDLFGAAMWYLSPASGMHFGVAEVVGMTSLAVGIVGGPLTMTFLALESTGNLTLTGVVLAAAIVSALVVRSIFGYSFSTWRLHLRGETIRSAHDVGWMRNLTVRRMMRPDVRTIDADTTIADFRAQIPLGSAQRVVATTGDGVYAGMVIVADAYADRSDSADDAASIRTLLRNDETVLVPPMNAKAAAETFNRSGAEELAVVDGLRTRKVIGLLTEGHLMRRYSEELEKARRDLAGEA